MKSTDIFICCSCIAVFLFCHTFIITVLINNAFKTVQQSAKNKEDICRHALTHGKDSSAECERQGRYLTQNFTL